MSHRIINIGFLLLVIIIGLYAINWVTYGLEYVQGRQAFIHYYHVTHPTYPCTGVATATNDYSPISIKPKSLLIPAEGISYSVDNGFGSYITGNVIPFGAVNEVNMGKDIICGV